MPIPRIRTTPSVCLLVFVLLVGAAAAGPAQERQVVVTNAEIQLDVGDSVQLSARVVDNAGEVLDSAPLLFYSLARNAVSVTPDGLLTAHRAGEFRVAAMSPNEIVPDEPADRTGRYDAGARTFITVIVAPPPVSGTKLVIDSSGPLLEGMTVPLAATVIDASMRERPEITPHLESTVPAVVSVGSAGTLEAHSAGTAVVRATVGETVSELEIEVRPNSTSRVALESPATMIRTGDVLALDARAFDASGSLVEASIHFAVESFPDPARPESVGAGAPAQIDADGRFVAEQPGVYVVHASVGNRAAEARVTVLPRSVEREVELLGQAVIDDRVTSDLWVWEGADGRDYAIVGTWNAEGHAYFYDVTDPTEIRKVDEVQVDARTVNDVKISEDGRVAVISREGASNRRNGLVILDVSDPTNVEVLAQFDDQLTGGVHNIFVHADHVYAVNNGRRVDIINIEDPRNPHRVGRFETDTPGRSVHDVWVHDGIAYEAGRTDGLIVFDVGGGNAGGAPNRPVEMARIAQLTGWNHSAWPYTSPSTGKRYVLGGDEAFQSSPLAPQGGGILWREGLPSRAKGWIHFIDITDPDNPIEAARYQVPESGPHNYWIDEESELLYIGHFDAGLRVVDISGDLMGDLYRQGREVAKFFTDDPEGFIPNAPFVWGPQPHKGTIFLADFSSGLWAVRLGDPTDRTGLAAATTPAFAESAGSAGGGPVVTPGHLEMTAGESSVLAVEGTDPEAPILFFSRSPLGVSVTPAGVVTAHRPGDYELVALSPAADVDRETANAGDPGQRTVIPVRVSPSAATRLELHGLPSTVTAGDAIPVRARIVDETGQWRDVRPVLSVDDESIAIVTSQGPIFGGSANAHPFYRRERPDVYPGEAAALFEAKVPGSVTVEAEYDGLGVFTTIEIVPNPVEALQVNAASHARTGDVVPIEVEARDAGGEAVAAPLRYAVRSYPDDSRAESIGAGSAAHVLADGRFVAEQPGLYVVTVSSGAARSDTAIRVEPRNVARPIEFLGQGPVRDRVTSDLWIWEGQDGRDYAITGTWQAEGHAYFWDVTDPTAMKRIAEVQVDARTVNDVKVSDDGRIAVISREGASNRRNGLVILDVSNPYEPQVLARYDDQMTGGVHNVFIHQDHVYAINNGRRWDILNIEDPTRPVRVGRFESSVPGRSVHDVWVRDGVAFQAGNTEGIVVVDVGGGGAGGSPNRPVEIGRMPQLTGWNHAVWPYRSASTGKFYVIAGDESHPVNPRDPANIISVDSGMASRAMGWLHFIEFDDMAQPNEVARYRVPESGPHNLWVDWDNDVLYVAFFNGGLRVVDLSGDLVGDLYRQGREIAKFYSDDPDSFIPNAPMVWGPQPYKGNIFFSDFHSGLWAVRLGEAEAER